MLPLLLTLALIVVVGGVIWSLDLRRRSSLPSVDHLDTISRQVGDRLLLRPPERADLDFLVEMANDPVAIEANGWDRTEELLLRQRFASRKQFRQMQASELIAVERDGGARVGTLRFAAAPHGPEGAVSIGIHVHADHRNHGYGGEMMAGGIELVRRTGAPARVGTRVTNVGMQRVMERLGYEPEPGLRDYVAPNGRTYDAYWYDCDPPAR